MSLFVECCEGVEAAPREAIGVKMDRAVKSNKGKTTRSAIREGRELSAVAGTLTSKADLHADLSDAELVTKILAGRKDLYRQLVEKYQARAYGLAFDILRSPEDAEDVVQESFVKAYISLKDFRGQAAFYTWLYRIVYNMAIDVKRKLVRRKDVDHGYDETRQHDVAEGSPGGPSRPEGPEEVMVRKEQSSQIGKALSSLSEEHRMVVTLREIDGLSYDEIARVVGVSKGTVMSRLHYARKKLQEVLAGSIEPSAVKFEVADLALTSSAAQLKGVFK